MLYTESKAQTIRTSDYGLEIGFWGGKSGYIGDYNGSFLGTGFKYSDSLSTKNSFFTGQHIFGLDIFYPLFNHFEVTGRFAFGSVSYSDPKFSYNMKTPYNQYGMSLKYLTPKIIGTKPYISLGLNYISYTIPGENTISTFASYSANAARKAATTLGFPIGIGFNYRISDKAELYVESIFEYTLTNDLDNYIAPQGESGSSFTNDILISANVGIRARIIDFIRIIIPEPKRVNPSAYKPRFSSIPDFALQLPEQIELLTFVEPEPIDTVVESKPIKEVDPENRTFDREIALQDLQALIATKENEDIRNEIDERSTLDWDPTIPVISSRPSPIPEEILENGFVIGEFPPDGYYVQVYASVGPITAQNARKMTMELLEGVVANPNRQTIITKRNQFYEVRIGVFDTYDDTLIVLRAVQGTFFDAYTLIYIPD